VGEWQPISSAPRDRTPVLVVFHKDIYPRIEPSRDDLERLHGIQAVLRHHGYTDGGYDMGWGFAAPVGYGGLPDSWIAGWQPLPDPPV
jgi:hypothetical protein